MECLWSVVGNFMHIIPYMVEIWSKPLDSSKKFDIYSFTMVASAVSLRKTVAVCHALSDETRLRLLERLKGGEHCVCELTEAMKAGQSRLSFHLKVLKEAGLIRDRREGRWMYYAINDEAIDELQELVDSLKEAAKSAASAGKCC